MCAIAYIQAALNIDSVRDQLIDLGEQRVGIENDAVPDRASHTGMHDPARDLVQNERFVADVNGVPCIRSALIAHDPVGSLRDDVDELSLPFIAPLRPNYYDGARLRIEHATPVRGEIPGKLRDGRERKRTENGNAPGICTGR